MDNFDPEDVVPRYEREIIMASYLYYSGSDDMQSPLSDAEYDQRVQFVCANWWATSPAFKKRITRAELAASGYSLRATKAEQAAALRWMRERGGRAVLSAPARLDYDIDLEATET